MVERFPADLGHFSFNVGSIGHLQTQTLIPVIANDSLSVNMEGIIRLSPLRRNLTVDAKIDMFAFFVPHRHIYGDTWIDFIKEGNSEDETFTGVSIVTTDLRCMGNYYVGETAPLWVVAGYNRIWNRYFRSPTDAASLRADTYLPTGTVERFNGYSCGPLPVPWSTGVDAAVPDAKREVTISASVLDIADLAETKASYRSEVDRKFMGQRYTDILDVAFGTGVNTDADQRPELVAHSSNWISGYDVDGTDNATLGQYAGKSMGQIKFGFGRKRFREHGALWIMSLVRFPTVHVKERPYLNTIVNPSYLQISGDPELVGAQKPQALTADMFFSDGSGGNTLGIGPYGQWYRYHPSFVHRAYHELSGFTFIDTTPTNNDTAWYLKEDEYDAVFQTNQLGNWQSQARIDVDAFRVVPPARRSLYAGG
jgi:hypothetical protein